MDVSKRNISIKIFNKTYDAPFAIAPTGLNSIVRPRGDLLLARAAARANISFTLSTAANISIEELAKQCDGEKWFQLYIVTQDLAEQLVKEH